MADAQQILEQLKKDYQHIFDTDEGKRVLADLQRRCFFQVSTFVPDNANETFVREGQRSVVLHIINMITKKEK